MVCTSAFCQGHALLRGCLWKEDPLLRGTANVLIPGHAYIFTQSFLGGYFGVCPKENHAVILYSVCYHILILKRLCKCVRINV